MSKRPYFQISHHVYWPLVVLCICLLSADNNRPFDLTKARDQREAQWVDSVFAILSDDAKIGQLFTIRAHSDKDAAYEMEVENLIRQYKPGGVCFFNPTHVGTPEKQAILTNRYQAIADSLPLMISMDLEHGLGMRFRDFTISYPRQLMLGAIQDNALIYEMGREIARQCRRLGVHINFAPVADINNNAANPVINERSFGEDRNNVAAKCFQYMMGLQDGNVLACAKHFPGHGDTDIDSHLDLPTIPYDRSRLDSLELFPFKVLSQYGVGSMMIAHLQVPAIDARQNRPTSLSESAVTKLLRNDMGFEGLIFTDGMGMEGVTKHYKPGMSDVEAFKAGNDVNLLPENLGAAVEAVKTSLANGYLDKAKIDESVKKILRVKYRLGLTVPQRVNPARILEDLNTPNAYALKQKLINNALTLVRDNPGIVGFQDLNKFKIATLAIGDTNLTVFQKTCGIMAPVAHFNTTKVLDSLSQLALFDSLRQFDLVLVSLHDTRSSLKHNFGLTDNQVNFIQRLNSIKTVVLTVFGNPYSLRYFDDIPVVLEAYTEDPLVQEQAAAALFGAADLKGKLPVTASRKAVYGQGVFRDFSQSPRLGFALPEQVGLLTDSLLRLDAIVSEMINTGAAPGCQILVAKNGKIVWNKSYGFHNYEQTTPVNNQNIYDLASITKVAATTISAMKLVDQKQMDVQTTMATYVPELAKTAKKDLTVREIMAHHAGLKAWIPFYEQTVSKEKTPLPQYYRSTPEQDYTIPVAENLYLKESWRDSIWLQIFNSELRENKDYKYSDLGLYLTARAVQNLSQLPVDAYANQQFYGPMGLTNMCYNPALKGLKNRCVPSEDDNYFRHQKIQGHVHDMGAAMLGGVSGHAGLFSNATDLAKLFQMLLNGGSYGGKQYLQAATINQFTTRFEKSQRRGIGFDMKELNAKESANMSPLAGDRTFGHLGFTGTCVWADPDQQLIFIFLSNRTYPTMNNGKLSSGDYRPRLQSVVYNSIKK